MSREMAAPMPRVKLIIQVQPLTAGNAHGARSEQAIAAFKSRKFALPVCYEDTFETVWKQIEDRHKQNYLTPQQAAVFGIKKLQDVDDCDLDLSDTVRSIFEAETDPARRLIKVVPCYVNRDFSVPVTSNLRPVYAQKRPCDVDDELANKRRRIEQQQLMDIEEPQNPVRDQPVPTTESERSADTPVEDGTSGAHADSRLRRSHTGGSLVLVDNTQTGHAEFGLSVKEESPELGLPSSHRTRRTPSEEYHSSRTPAGACRPHSHKQLISTSPSRRITNHVTVTEEPAIDYESAQNEPKSATPPLDSQDAVVYQSPQSSPSSRQHTPAPATTKRKDIYDISSSPEFLQRGSAKGKTTYGRSPRTAKTVQKEVDLLNTSRLLTTATPKPKNKGPTGPLPSTEKSRTFQLPDDEIESTPEEQAIEALRRGKAAEVNDEGADLTSAFLEDAGRDIENGIHTPTSSALGKSARPGSLKKPFQSIVISTPSTTRRGIRFESSGSSPLKSIQPNNGGPAPNAPSTPGSSSSKPVVIAPHIQAKLDELKLRRAQRRKSPKIVIRSRPGSSQSHEDLDPSAGGSHINGTSHHDKQATTSPFLSVATQDTKSARLGSITSNDNAQLPKKPRPSQTTPARSPVPLPENVRHLAPNGIMADRKGSTPEGNGVLKQSVRKNQRSASQSRTDGDSSQHAGSQSTKRTNTLRGWIEGSAQKPVQQFAKTTDSGSPKSSSAGGSIGRAQTPLIDARGLSVTSSTPGNPGSTLNTRHKASPALPTMVPRKRGRPKKSDSTDASQVLVATTNRKPETNVIEKASSTKPRKMANTEDAIVISSDEPSSSEDSDDLGPEATQSELRPSLQNEHVEPELSGSADISELNGVRSQQEQQSVLSADIGRQMRDDDDDDIVATKSDTGATRKVDTAIISQPLQTHPTGSPIPEQISQETNQKAGIWTSGLWNFGNLALSDSIANEPVDKELPEVRARSPPEVAIEHMGASASSIDDKQEEELESSSASAAVSTRSSPAVTRQPARFLSHSPTPDDSNSEDESEEASVVPSKGPTYPQAQPREESESDSSSESESSDTGEEDEEMPDVSADPMQDTAADRPIEGVPSSPPPSRPPPDSTPVVPETSQPYLSQLPRKTPVPLPPNSQIRSSQSVSAQAEARRSTARYAGFKTLREQLVETKRPPTAAQKKTFDPRTLNLGKLAAKVNPAVSVGLGNDDSSDDGDEESSDSSDSD